MEARAGGVMRCEANTRRGGPCARRARGGQRLCASHAGRPIGRARPRDGLGHGLYGQGLPPEERLALALARATEGVDEEIATTRLMIQRLLRDEDPSSAEYA